MRDFKKDSSAQVARFGRDKRERGTKPSFEERRPRSQRDAADAEQTPTKRASYNPRFTADNRPMESRTSERRGGGYGDKPFKKSYAEGGSGERREFGGEKKPFKKSYGDRPS
ncbi:MAG: pseudouridine synthase, partial [Rikenellaceae bacterium]